MRPSLCTSDGQSIGLAAQKMCGVLHAAPPTFSRSGGPARSLAAFPGPCGDVTT